MKRLKNLLITLLTRRLVIDFDKNEFVYENLPWKKLKNWFLDELSWVFKTSKAWAYPTLIQIEPTNVCNLRCPLCHVVTDNKPRGFMEFKRFKQVMDEIGDYLLFLHFWGWGEPFLSPDFLKMVRYAKKKGIKIISSTNGHFFRNNEDIDDLIDSGLDVLIFAIDGLDRETYDKYRKKGDFDRAVSNLRRLLRRRNELNASTPVVNLRMLVTRDNEKQVVSMKKFAEEKGVDIFTLKTLCSFDNETTARQILPENPDYRRFEYDASGNPIRIKNRCRKPWNHPVIYRDGIVVPCDYHTGDEFSLGNAFNGNQSNFSRVWFGEAYRSFRARFREKQLKGLRCDSCALNYAYVDRCVSHAFKIH
ncbi:radical SAM protein [Thermodesulfobacteriota bacterium]